MKYGPEMGKGSKTPPPMPKSNHSARSTAKLGELFKITRELGGISESDVLQYFPGLQLETLRKYESGEMEMPLFIVCGMANLLNLPPDQVLALLEK